MDCGYCHIAMEPIGMGVYNGWRCPNCKHEEVEMGSWKLAGEPTILRCGCCNCRVNKLDDMNFTEFNLKLFCLYKIGCEARAKMFNGDRVEAMKLYKLIGEDLRMWGEYLKKLVY
jgi:hypothetical protein